MTTHTALNPATNNRHYKGQAQNLVTFTVSLATAKMPSDTRVVSLEQVGTTSGYVLTEKRCRRVGGEWTETELHEPQKITGKEIAWAVYKARRALARAEACYVLGEVIYTRPVGITDPLDRAYVAANIRVIRHKGAQPGNCYYSSTEVVGRCDDAPLTADDIAALKAYPRGQVHQVTGEPGDMTATVHSEVDSSD